MPWKEQTMSEQRKSLVEEIKLGEENLSSICRKYGITRPTAYKWLYRSETDASFSEHSRMPLHSPTRTEKSIEDLIIHARNEHQFWGSRKLKAYLERRYGIVFPCANTINNILHRHGLISREASLSATPYKRFERKYSNDLWQTDFKGHFEMSDGNRCHALTVTDDFSRYNLCISAKDNECLPGVLESFLSLFEEYGLPNSILCDNGAPWGVSSYFGGYTKFEAILLDYDILPIHGRPLHPQTQGKEERFHRTLKRELLNNTEIKDLPSAQEKFDLFRKKYNEIRPHCALDYAVPADRYEKSKRKMPKQIYEWEYESGIEVRKVRNGYINFKNINFFFSEAFEGKNLALIYSPEDEILYIVYRNFMLAQMSMKERCFISKKIKKREKEENCAD
jgi:transposase InsO family protein